ncbi:MAG: DUF5809 family protein [Halobacteriaceae archaeon]
MDTQGFLSPQTSAEVSDIYTQLGSSAQTITREAAKAMDFDEAEYNNRVTSEVVHTVHDALFSSLLKVNIGTQDEFENVRKNHAEYSISLSGTEHVSHVAWHVAHIDDTIVATTFEEERTAAVSTLRRIVYGEVYQEYLNSI